MSVSAAVRAAMASRVCFMRLGASLVQRGPPRAHKALLAEEVLWTGPLATTRTRAAPIATVSRLGPSRSYAVVSFAGLGSVIVPEFVLAAIWPSSQSTGAARVATVAIRTGDVAEEWSTPPRTRDGGLGSTLDAWQRE